MLLSKMEVSQLTPRLWASFDDEKKSIVHKALLEAITYIRENGDWTVGDPKLYKFPLEREGWEDHFVGYGDNSKKLGY